MDQHLRYRSQIRGMGWQRTQMAALKFQASCDGIVPPGHDALLIGEAVLAKLYVDGFQISALWKRHEVVAARIAHQILHAAFLPPGMHIGKEGLKAIDTVEVQKHVVLASAMPFEHLQHGCFEVVFDNLKAAVLQVLKGHSRREHDVFLHFHSVYRFEALFANVHAGWEKGSVENLVGYARRNYLVPLPEGTDLDAINVELRQNCLADQQRVMAGRNDPIARRLEFERSHLGPLPTHAPDLGPIAEVLVHSTGRVRFQTNDYSAPIQYVYRRLTLKADPFRVRLYAGEALVADHPRSYEKRQVIEDWRHYVPLLLHKSFAVPWASALRHGDLPSSFEAARLELVARRPDGNREFARLLELCLTHEVQAVEAAIALARGQGDWNADTVRQLLRWAAEPDAAVLPLDPARYPAYQGSAPVPNLSAYNQLLEVRP